MRIWSMISSMRSSSTTTLCVNGTARVVKEFLEAIDQLQNIHEVLRNRGGCRDR